MKFKVVNPKSEEQWLKLRCSCLTASDIGVLLGLNPYKTMTDVEESKQSWEPFDNEYMELGRFLEPRIVDEVNWAVNDNFQLFGDNSFYHSPELKLGATPDASNQQTLLECKSTSPKNFLRWQHFPPYYYLAQLYTQMICCDYQEGYLAIRTTDMSINDQQKLIIFRLTRTEELDNILLDEVKRYWQFKKDEKTFRINRKQSLNTMVLFLINLERIF